MEYGLSQFLYFKSSADHRPLPAGFSAIPVRSATELEKLVSLFGGDIGVWFELQAENGDVFEVLFEAVWQDPGQSDGNGHTFEGLVRELVSSSQAVVLSYGPVGTDVSVTEIPNDFLQALARAYTQLPVELHCAWVAQGPTRVE